MSRDGSGIYSFPTGGAAVSGAAIGSSAYNTRMADLLDDLNAARPITAGGTGAITAAAARTALGVQALDATLTALAALVTSADTFIFATGVDTFSQASVTTFARTILDDAAATNVRTTLGLVIGTDVQAYDANTAKINSAATWSAAQSIRIKVSSETTGTLTSASANASVLCSGGVTLPTAVFTAGDVILFDSNGASRTFTRGASVTMYVNGANAATATLGIDQLGSAYWRSSTVVVLGGAFT